MDESGCACERLRRALHEIAECGESVHAQEAYAIGLAKRMYELAAEALRPGGRRGVSVSERVCGEGVIPYRLAG